MNIKAMVWLGILLAVLLIVFLVYYWFVETIILLSAASAGEVLPLIGAQKQDDETRGR